MHSAPVVTGIYGGSFNPIHLGHTRLGEWLCRKGWLDELWFLVSPLNPLKAQNCQELLKDEVRLHLAQLAVANKPHLRVSDFEMKLPRPSYMVHTLAALRQAYPERRFVLVIGADNWLCFEQWREPDEILRHHEVIIYPREGYPIDSTTLPENVHLVQAPLFETSSSDIRKAIAGGKCRGRWLTPAVWREIREKKLYFSISTTA